MKVLVTGSAGFLGRNVSQFLKNKGFEVSAFDKKEGQDLTSDKDLEEALKKDVDYICHLAAVGDVYVAAEDPKEAAIAGVGGTANLVKIAQNFEIKKIIYASTWEVYGKPKYQPIDENHPCFPDHPYSIAKYAGELFLRSKLAKIPWIILRLGTAYGAYMRSNAVIPRFIDKAKKGEKITIMGDGSQKRQFTHAKDIANAFYLSIEKPIENEVFNITSKNSNTIKKLAEEIIKHHPTEIEYLPPREGDIEPAQVSTKKAKKLLSWEAKIPFERGLLELL